MMVTQVEEGETLQTLVGDLASTTAEGRVRAYRLECSRETTRMPAG